MKLISVAKGACWSTNKPSFLELYIILLSDTDGVVMIGVRWNTGGQEKEKRAGRGWW
jgi:hypothetical protein